MNKFEEAYKLMVKARKEKDTTLVDEAQKIVDSMVANDEERQIAYQMYNAYSNSKKANNEILNFHDIVFESWVPTIVKLLKENKITKFTISCDYSGINSTMLKLQKNGYELKGLVEVNYVNYELYQEKIKKIPALLFELKEDIIKVESQIIQGKNSDYRFEFFRTTPEGFLEYGVEENFNEYILIHQNDIDYWQQLMMKLYSIRETNTDFYNKVMDELYDTRKKNSK